jgi:KDO2-lipid IV(A) lauroyltransferase
MKYRLEYALVKTLFVVVRLMPDPLVRAAGTLLGRAVYTFDRARRGIAHRNLASAFPWRTERERKAIARAAFGHFGRLLVELMKFSTLSDTMMLARVEFDGKDRARLAYAQGRGVLFFTGHFGFWDCALVHALALEPFSVIASARQPVSQHPARYQAAHGNPVISPGMIRQVMRLQAGHGIAVLIDQHIQARDAVSVDFFERPAATTSAIAALAIRTGAPVVPCFALPLGPGRYRMIYEHPIEPPRADSADAVHEFTQRCTDVLEMYVRRHPELWLWMHRRWRDEGEPAESEDLRV